MSKAILHACTIDGKGGGEPLEGAAVSNMLKSQQLAWVHLDAGNPKTREWLEREVSYLDHIILDALLAEETRPRILEFDQGAMMILRGVNLNENSRPEDMVSIRLWADDQRIITMRNRDLKAVDDIREKIAQAIGPKNTGDFVTMLAGRLLERMEPVFSDLDEALDDIEEQVIEHPDIEERTKITELRKQAIMFRRYVAPQRDVIAHLRTSDISWLDQNHKRRLQESLDRVIRYVEDLDSIRERAQIVKDELTSVLADRLNKNMYVLTIVAAIFLPLGFLTGLLGINVGGIPGADNPHAFFIFAGMLVALVGAQIAYFKWLKWF